MTRRGERGTTYRLALSAVLLSLMLILGWVEAMLPLNIGVPGIKLGLSNGVLIFAVCMLDIPTAYVLMTLKVVLSGLMFSGVSAMMYGLCGGFISLTCMTLMSGLCRPSKEPKTGLMGSIRRAGVPIVGVTGGIMHNVGQVSLSILIAHLPARVMLVYMGWLSLAGAVCGFLTGFCAMIVMRHMRSAGMKPPAKRGGTRTQIVTAVLAVVIAAVLAWVWSPKLASEPVQDQQPTVTIGGDSIPMGNEITFP